MGIIQCHPLMCSRDTMCAWHYITIILLIFVYTPCISCLHTLQGEQRSKEPRGVQNETHHHPLVSALSWPALFCTYHVIDPPSLGWAHGIFCPFMLMMSFVCAHLCLAVRSLPLLYLASCASDEPRVTCSSSIDTSVFCHLCANPTQAPFSHRESALITYLLSESGSWKGTEFPCGH